MAALGSIHFFPSIHFDLGPINVRLLALLTLVASRLSDGAENSRRKEDQYRVHFIQESRIIALAPAK